MSGYIGSTPVPQATQHRESFTATSGQTTFATAGYTAGFVDVYLNGSHLSPADFVGTNGSDVVLVSGAAADDVCDIISYTPFEVNSQTFTGTTTMDVATVGGALTAAGAVQLNNTLTVGANDQGYDVTLHGDTAARNVKWDSSADSFVFTDLAKLIFGADSEMQIFSDGTNGIINETGGGNLNLQGTNVFIKTADGSATCAHFFAGDAAALYFSNAAKIATTNTGATVTGTLTATKLVSADGVLELDDNGSHNGIINSPASLRINIDSDNGATGESFAIGHNQTAIDANNILFSVAESGDVNITGDVVIENTSNAPFIDFVESGANTDSKARITMDQIDGSNGQLIFSTEKAGTLTQVLKLDQAGNAIIDGDLIVGNTSIGSKAGDGIIAVGADGAILTNSANSLADDGTLDIAVNTGGGGYQGFLSVANTVTASANARTQSTFSVFGRGTDSSIQQIATDTGGSAATFTVTTPSNGLIRVTNTSGNTCNTRMQFFGGASL